MTHPPSERDNFIARRIRQMVTDGLSEKAARRIAERQAARRIRLGRSLRR